MLSCSDSAAALRRPLTGWRRNRIEWTNRAEAIIYSLFSSVLLFFFVFCFLGRAQHYCDRVIHLEYANSWQCICLLVLDLPLGGRSPTQLRSLSAVCLQTPVILPHSATLRQSHFSTSHPRCVCLEAVGTGWGTAGREGRGGEGCRTNDVGVGSALQRNALWQQSWKLSLQRPLTSRSLPLVLVKTNTQSMQPG